MPRTPRRTLIRRAHLVGHVSESQIPVNKRIIRMAFNLADEMLFSEEFNIKRTSRDDWFDPILDTDTPVFVDPFLIFKETGRQWAGAHDELIMHFDNCFHLIAQGNRSRASVAYKKALRLLTFPEPKEVCLGYTKSGTGGAGGGKGYAKLIAEAMEAAIARGLTDLRHFEELGILNEGIGPDRISDFTCNVLRARLIAYTKGVAARHHLPTKPVKIAGAAYDPQRVAWVAEMHDLPWNPYNKRAVLLVPERFLRDLPTINADDWWENYEAEQIRDDVNYEVMGKVDKKRIVATARRRVIEVAQWARAQEARSPDPYDIASDKNGIYQWDRATRSYANHHPVSFEAPEDDRAFFAIVDRLVAEFRLYIEEQRGWKLLWNDDSTEKHEEAAQLAFMGLARSYCRANNIVVDREVNLGKGPVDFKFSSGYARRALLEIKKLHNGKFWNGLTAQLPSYLSSDQCRDGWFVAIQYRDGGTSPKRLLRLPNEVRLVADRTATHLRFQVVDARPKESASKLTNQVDDSDQD